MALNTDIISERLMANPNAATGKPASPLSALEAKVEGLTNMYYNHIIKIHDLSEENHQLKVYIFNMRHYSENKFAELNVAKNELEQKLKTVSDESGEKDAEIERLRAQVLELQSQKSQTSLPAPSKLQRLLEAPRRVPEHENFAISHLITSSSEVSSTSLLSSPGSLDSEQMPTLSSEKEEEVPFVKTFEEAIKINSTFDFGVLAGRDLSSYLFNPLGDRTLPQKVGACRNRYNFFQNQAKSSENTYLQWADYSDDEKEHWKKMTDVVLAIQEVQEKYGMVVVDVLGRKRERKSAGSANGDKRKKKGQ